MKFFKHLHTINKHRFIVFKICCKIGIPFQGLLHDLSKYSFTEFIPGVKYYQGNKSPNVRERELFGYSKAWLHHKGRNKHHFEYWIDVDPKTKCYGPCLMPLKYVKEMFADRIAATKVYQGKNYRDGLPLEYFVSKEENLEMNEITKFTIKSWLKMLEEKGEKITFKYVKNFKEEDYGKGSSKVSNL